MVRRMTVKTKEIRLGKARRIKLDCVSFRSSGTSRDSVREDIRCGWVDSADFLGAQGYARHGVLFWG